MQAGWCLACLGPQEEASKTALIIRSPGHVHLPNAALRTRIVASESTICQSCQTVPRWYCHTYTKTRCNQYVNRSYSNAVINAPCFGILAVYVGLAFSLSRQLVTQHGRMRESVGEEPLRLLPLLLALLCMAICNHPETQATETEWHGAGLDAGPWAACSC